MPMVLIIEDESDWQRIYQDRLDRDIRIIKAYSIAAARQKMLDHAPVDLMVVDGYLGPQSSLDATIQMVKDFRQTFKGPMVAASANVKTNALLMSAGCDSCVISGKHEVPSLVHQALKRLRLFI